MSKKRKSRKLLKRAAILVVSASTLFVPFGCSKIKVQKLSVTITINNYNK